MIGLDSSGVVIGAILRENARLESSASAMTCPFLLRLDNLETNAWMERTMRTNSAPSDLHALSRQLKLVLLTGLRL